MEHMTTLISGSSRAVGRCSWKTALSAQTSGISAPRPESPPAPSTGTLRVKRTSHFVQPAVDEIKKDFVDAEPICREAIEAGDIRRLWMIMDADRLLDYIYRNFDALKLLLKCSDGTKYSDFLNDVVWLETDISLRSLGLAKERGFISAELPSETEMHMICHAYISSVFEAVLHDLSREDMEKYIHTIVKFFTAGAYQVLEL